MVQCLWFCRDSRNWRSSNKISTKPKQDNSWLCFNNVGPIAVLLDSELEPCGGFEHWGIFDEQGFQDVFQSGNENTGMVYVLHGLLPWTLAVHLFGEGGVTHFQLQSFKHVSKHSDDFQWVRLHVELIEPAITAGWWTQRRSPQR